ncbi:SMI1/KNR4 family protein [Flavobacterium piscinae]|uniref:SMI1/KNR4 family protein n=1 Tax=Flavobacterium piscinae TaxID=2506424 RepID=A0A4Q1KYL9_9FLAO|nr:SMI1/KNR4 family protein [Flavobacterium piscinae]MBC8884063.1 SMI1/KNR4 family protein [Flavobacterium piscinae]RXR34830.1 SMI1/KNR4 family protein [Flavobacterium piscinae]
MLKILDSEKKINDIELLEFENKYNVSIPNNYKTFIKKYNGGFTEDSEIVDKFLSIQYGIVTVALIIESHQVIEKNIPNNYLPIALDWSDNPITINLNEGADNGKIVKFYFDTDQEPEIVANSLEELLEVKSIDEI